MVAWVALWIPGRLSSWDHINQSINAFHTYSPYHGPIYLDPPADQYLPWRTVHEEADDIWTCAVHDPAQSLKANVSVTQKIPHHFRENTSKMLISKHCQSSKTYRQQRAWLESVEQGWHQRRYADSIARWHTDIRCFSSLQSPSSLLLVPRQLIRYSTTW